MTVCLAFGSFFVIFILFIEVYLIRKRLKYHFFNRYYNNGVFIFNKYGYAWIFPKDEHYNVGIGNLVHSSKSKKITKKDLHSFVLDRFGLNKIEMQQINKMC